MTVFMFICPPISACSSVSSHSLSLCFSPPHFQALPPSTLASFAFSNRLSSSLQASLSLSLSLFPSIFFLLFASLSISESACFPFPVLFSTYLSAHFFSFSFSFFCPLCVSGAHLSPSLNNCLCGCYFVSISFPASLLCLFLKACLSILFCIFICIFLSFSYFYPILDVEFFVDIFLLPESEVNVE